MKRTLICLALAVTAIVHAEPVPKNFVKMYLAQDKQFAAGDWKGFFANYSDRYVYTQADGKTFNHDQFVSLVKNIVKGATKRELHTQFTGCETTATEVKLSYTQTFVFTNSAHKTARFKEVAVDAWHSENGQWKEISTKDKSFGPA